MRRRFLQLLPALALASGLVSISTPASAFLDLLFAGRAAPSASPTYQMDFDASPRARARRDVRKSPSARQKLAGTKIARKPDASARKPRVSWRSGPSSPAGGLAQPGLHGPSPSKDALARRQRSIDPAKVPDWYLRDPNLRPGDIVVLPTGPVVFQGAAKAGHASFVALRGSKSVPKSVVHSVGDMFAGIWSPPAEAPTAKVALRTASKAAAKSRFKRANSLSSYASMRR